MGAGAAISRAATKEGQVTATNAFAPQSWVAVSSLVSCD